MAKKTAPMTMNPTTLLLMVVAILVIAYIIVSSTTGQAPATPQESLDQSSDLNAELDRLEATNVDSLDSGTNELGAEVSRY